MIRIDWPFSTLAARPVGFPKARRIPSCNLSAPAVAIILFSRRIICGYTHSCNRYPVSPHRSVRILFADTRADSKALWRVCTCSLATKGIFRANWVDRSPMLNLETLGAGDPWMYFIRGKAWPDGEGYLRPSMSKYQTGITW